MPKQQVHIILQGKGGVGKSVVASFITQYFNENKLPVVAVDTDPNNATLSGYKTLDVKRLSIINPDGTIVQREFDSMIEELAEDQESHYVIDNGSVNFPVFKGYLVNNEIIDLLSGKGREVYIHTVLKGGQELMMTLSGFDLLAEQIPEPANLVVWLNEYMGEIKGGGKTFEEMKVYKRNMHRVVGLIRLEHEVNTLFGEDIKKMLASSLTFEDVENSSDFGLMAKSRLFRVKKSIFEQLEKAIQKGGQRVRYR